MSDEGFSFQVDQDWKKQARAEKQRLAEQEAKEREAKAAQAAARSAPAATPGAAASGAEAVTGRRRTRTADFAGHVQSLVSQILYYLGGVSLGGAEPSIDLDLAKYHIDILAMLKQKTQGNLTEEEQVSLATALYEARMRFIAVGSRMIQ